MKCNANCDGGEDASIFFSYVEEGKIIKVNLCKKCAQEKGINDPAGYALLDMLEGMGEEGSTANPHELKCPACGFGQSDFKKTGRFGCAECYGVFTDGLETLIEAMHKKTVHVGRTPGRTGRGEPADSPKPMQMPPTFGADSPPVETPGRPFFNEAAPPPPPVEAQANAEASLVTLRDQLDLAISAENYEEAARIRDAIARLERKKN